MDVSETSIEQEGQFVSVTEQNGHCVRHGVRWLRINCKCKDCKQPFSGMYPLDATCLDADLKVKSTKTLSSELKCLLTSSCAPEHEITIPLEYLRKTCNCETCFGSNNKRIRPPPLSRKSVVNMDFSELDSNEGMFKCLEHIIKDGYCVLANSTIKTKEDFMETAEKFGCSRRTSFGLVFDLQNDVDQVITDSADANLPPHQVLHYYENSPGVQILTAIRFENGTRGGELQLVDLLECAEILRTQHPDEFETLTRVPLTFGLKDQSQFSAVYHHTKTVIDVDYFNEIVGVSWIPFTENVLRVGAGDAEAFYKAHKIFRNIIEDPKNQLLLKLKLNDCLMINNRRIGHGRHACAKSEEAKKQLYGGYVDIDDLKSKYVVLAAKLGKEVLAAKLGNRSSF